MTSQADKNSLTIQQIKHNMKFDTGTPGGSVVKNPSANAGDVGSIPGLGRSPGKGNVNLLQYSCLGNLMDREAWWASPWGRKRVRHDLATKQQQQCLMLCRHTHTHTQPNRKGINTYIRHLILVYELGFNGSIN